MRMRARWFHLMAAVACVASLTTQSLRAQEPAPQAPEEEAEEEEKQAEAEKAEPRVPMPAGWRVDTLVIDEMSDLIAVRAMVGAKPGQRIQFAALGMECVMPRKTLETVLLVSEQMTWTAQPLLGESVTTRLRWSDEPPKSQGWGRYKAADDPGSAMKMFGFVTPATRSFLKHKRVRVELPLADGQKVLTDFELTGDARAALQAVFDHCRRKMPTP